MKKVYINPDTQVINIAVQQLMAGSEVPLGDPGSANNAEGRDNADDLWDD